MNKVSTSDRIKELMLKRKLKQIDILNSCQQYCVKYNVKLAKNDLSQYISGKVQPGQDKLTILALALNVNEVWLMGYNVDSEPKALCKSTLSNLSKSHEIENNILSLFSELNEDGQQYILQQIEFALSQDKYKKCDIDLQVSS